jgi:hypothetical protein
MSSIPLSENIHYLDNIIKVRIKIICYPEIFWLPPSMLLGT